MTNILRIALSVVLFCGIGARCGYLPPYITPCNMKHDFEGCARKQIEKSLPHFTKGIPESKVPSIDPFNLEDIKIDGQGLKLFFTEAQLHGVSDSKVTDLKVNMDDESFVFSFKVNVSLTGKYKIDGQILILPIQGEGNARVLVRNLDVVIKSKLQRHSDETGEHLKLTSPSYTYNMERTKFEFENLFNGNQALSDATHNFANENWKQIMDDLAPPVVKQIVRTGIKAINKFLLSVTTDQILVTN